MGCPPISRKEATMTKLEKPVHRLTRGSYSTLYARTRQIVVSLLPGDLIQFREVGARTKFTVPVDGIFRHAIRLKVASDQSEKKKRRIARKRGAC